ncbi:MAG: DUF488 domain-containing protein [Mojavia pulchra JT2-VF2]|jgi:uncharacterized protein (DUF488 family)|uniref:DUF488 domain-containing protein n=1 Tax=Mojavia pulchra JT2-VF2 TaxID=287848 RepID=A0A951UGQ3_9NOST|nr:DUF488 domain-containing protein [Mojavia pulchra JT2-VF2]
MEIFTIGHSNHSIEAFITLLQKQGVTALADVRSHPYSRYLQHFSQAPLKAALVNVGISYVFLGRELGARPSDTTCYVDGKALYEKIASTQQFADGIQRLLKGAENYKIALMCAEKDPITCHRAILICQRLRQFDLKINHILCNGDLETHVYLEERLLRLHKLKIPELPKQIQLSLFESISLFEPSMLQYSKEELLKKAYQQQGEKIAYVEKTENKYE